MHEPRWQNWFGLLLGIYIMVTPWLIPSIFSLAPASMITGIAGSASGLTLVSISLLGIVDPEIWLDWLKFLLGFGLLVTPWLFRFSNDIIITFSFVFAGMLLIVVSGLAFAWRRSKIGRDQSD
ncbi:hypothetical protein PH552_26205 [Rhizobium sp. CNPSo 3968]|uniref:SPW repeat domain-containing protein n=1 Tax=Rhizobium sp. CNPSo 3968 TaxID=3021408 RepID=UPI000DE037F2|nr:hypothetical protein [Rhizobium sp. CNPSo 3968]MDK4722854.1 hypothetical protein [Rhizobium sp. CNPSo 3968]